MIEAQVFGYNPRPSRTELAALCIEEQVYAEETDCHWCGREVDQSLEGATHPWGRTVDHIVPRWLGGDILARFNSRLARACKTDRHAQLRVQHTEGATR
ncbi:hypothetical protein [Streptomyces sp. JNUCC 63]